MSDARYDVYQHYGTATERAGFTPDPPILTGVQPIYIWYETDTLKTWIYHTTWVQVTGGGVVPPISATYLTESDETAVLTGSRQVLAGDGISFDDTVAGERTILALVDGTSIAINGSGEIEILDSGVTFAKMQDIATQTLIGRNTALTGPPESVTITQALDWLGE